MELNLETTEIQCPYCWQIFEIVVDLSEPQQEYIEDCYVCCRPIHLHIHVEEFGGVSVESVSEEDDY